MGYTGGGGLPFPNLPTAFARPSRAESCALKAPPPALPAARHLILLYISSFLPSFTPSPLLLAPGPWLYLDLYLSPRRRPIFCSSPSALPLSKSRPGPFSPPPPRRLGGEPGFRSVSRQSLTWAARRLVCRVLTRRTRPPGMREIYGKHLSHGMASQSWPVLHRMDVPGCLLTGKRMSYQTPFAPIFLS